MGSDSAVLTGSLRGARWSTGAEDGGSCTSGSSVGCGRHSSSGAGTSGPPAPRTRRRVRSPPMWEIATSALNSARDHRQAGATWLLFAMARRQRRQRSKHQDLVSSGRLLGRPDKRPAGGLLCRWYWHDPCNRHCSHGGRCREWAHPPHRLLRPSGRAVCTSLRAGAAGQRPCQHKHTASSDCSGRAHSSCGCGVLPPTLPWCPILHLWPIRLPESRPKLPPGGRCRRAQHPDRDVHTGRPGSDDAPPPPAPEPSP